MQNKLAPESYTYANCKDLDQHMNLHAKVRIDPEGLKTATRGSRKELPHLGDGYTYLHR